jgi:hypothetical protein
LTAETFGHQVPGEAQVNRRFKSSSLGGASGTDLKAYLHVRFFRPILPPDEVWTGIIMSNMRLSSKCLQKFDKNDFEILLRH